MEFHLFYKRYEYKVTWDSMRKYKRETGRDLWSVLMGVLNIFHCDKEQSTLGFLTKVADHVGVEDAAILLKCITLHESNLDLIADGVVRSGWLPIEDGDEKAQPYTFVLFKIAQELNRVYSEEAVQAKKDFGG